MAFALFFAAFLVWCALVKMPWWLHGFVALFAIYAVVYTGSRKTIIMLGCALVIILVRFAPRLKRLMTWLILAMGAALVFAVIALGIVNTRKLDVEGSVESIGTIQRLQQLLEGQKNVRFEMIEEALDLWLQSPIIGNGAGQFAAATSHGVYSHNNYTEVLCDYGVVGFCYITHYSCCFYCASCLPSFTAARSRSA